MTGLRRAQTGMTQTKLGAKVGLSLQAVQKYETGKNRISAAGFTSWALSGDGSASGRAA
jgi:transcriptional regulator with XRE-family HTH domain